MADFGRDLLSSESESSREPGEILFFLSRKQHRILPISLQPNFTKFEHNMSIAVAMNCFGTES